MPLNHSNSKAAVSANIKLIVDDWKQSGRIGTSHPRTKMQAVKQAVAVALSTADRSLKKNITSSKK
ncbi:hypothetical protein H8K32_14075 [Undibacterium jejuense]|uniref:Uncharacterized protein n=1 Tax=Undibacterium jejuense TaxID=1344949 RepID=A0A923HHR3_9BURK|nr:hypothetical protein [Undibacterium jejuense]MBC3863230.1 hypothetical protein [Undibacterium jejuense]